MTESDRPLFEQPDDPAYWEISDSDIADGGIVVAECETGDDAGFLRRILEENGVRSVVVTQGKALDVRPPHLRVAPGDEDKARSILAQPIPANKREEFDSEVDESLNQRQSAESAGLAISH